MNKWVGAIPSIMICFVLVSSHNLYTMIVGRRAENDRPLLSPLHLKGQPKERIEDCWEISEREKLRRGWNGDRQGEQVRTGAPR